MALRKRIARVPLIGPALIDFARQLRDPETQRAVHADLKETRQQLGWLRRAMPEPDGAAKRLLVISLTDFVYQLKLEGMLSAALKLRGWRPIVLTTSRLDTRALRYFRAFGVDEFLFLDDFAPSEEERAAAADAATRLLAGDLSFQAVKRWEFADAWVGPMVLSTVSRNQHIAAPDPRDPETRSEIARLLPETLARVLLAGRVAAAARPDLAMAIEANYALYGPFVDRLIARGVDVIQVVQPWRDDALSFKRLNRATRRMHPSSISPETFAQVLSRPWGEPEERELDQLFADRYNGKWFLQARNQPQTAKADAAAICQRFGLAAAKPTATVFSHILWDANLFYGEDLFQDYGEWFVETVRAAAANPEVNWLIKLHPANLWKRARDGVDGEFAETRLIREHIGALPPHVHIVAPDCGIDTLSLFRFTDYGVTVRGTSGMELPCFGKPTVTAGTGRYSGLGFTEDCATAAEYRDRLAVLHRLPMLSPERTLLARRHAHAAFLMRPWRMASFKSVFDYRPRGTQPLDHNLLCTVSSLDELDANGDLGRWGDWAGLREIDYLEPT
jgi:hypothetical protein